jgi:uncharacterized membrane protein
MLFTLIAYLPSDSIGLLDDDSFKYYIIDNDLINLFPLSIRIEANLLGFKLNYTLYQQISFNNKIYTKNNSNSPVNLALYGIKFENSICLSILIVKKLKHSFQFYSDVENNIIKILV